MTANTNAKAAAASKVGPKPKRPLSGYNLFYRYKRNKVLEATARASSDDNDNSNDDDDNNAIVNSVMTAIPGLEGIPPNSPILSLPPASLDEVRATAIRKSMADKLFPNENARSRVHRKVHGMGFGEMGRTMRDMWGNIDTVTKDVFCELADVGRVRYRNLMEAYKTRMESEMPSSSSSTVVTAMVTIDMSVASQEMGGKRTVGPTILKKDAKRAKKSGAMTSSSITTMVPATAPLLTASAKSTDISAMNGLTASRSKELSSLLPSTPRSQVRSTSDRMFEALSVAATTIHPESPAQKNKIATATTAAAVSPVGQKVHSQVCSSVSRRVSEPVIDMGSFEPLPLVVAASMVVTPDNGIGHRIVSAANSTKNSPTIHATRRSSMMSYPPQPFERKVTANNTGESISHDEIIAKTKFLEMEQIMLKNKIQTIKLKNAIQRIEQSILRKEPDSVPKSELPLFRQAQPPPHMRQMQAFSREGIIDREEPDTVPKSKIPLFRQEQPPPHMRLVQRFSQEGSIDMENYYCRETTSPSSSPVVSPQDFMQLIDDLDEAIGDDNDGTASDANGTTTTQNSNPSFIFGRPIYEMCDAANDTDINSSRARMA